MSHPLSKALCDLLPLVSDDEDEDDNDDGKEEKTEDDSHWDPPRLLTTNIQN